MQPLDNIKDWNIMGPLKVYRQKIKFSGDKFMGQKKMKVYRAENESFPDWKFTGQKNESLRVKKMKVYGGHSSMLFKSVNNYIVIFSQVVSYNFSQVQISVNFSQVQSSNLQVVFKFTFSQVSFQGRLVM